MKTTKFITTLLIFLCLSYTLAAQTNEEEGAKTQAVEQIKKKKTVMKPRAYIEDASIKKQFEFIMDKSFRWKTYKSVPIVWLEKFETSLTDSLNLLQNEILNFDKKINERDRTIKSLRLELKKNKSDLSLLKNDKNSMFLMGIQMTKATHSLVIWSLVGSLLVLAAFFFLLFKRGHSVTKDTQIRLEEVREDFDIHRKNALVREQKLARKLQDEINRNRNLGV